MALLHYYSFIDSSTTILFIRQQGMALLLIIHSLIRPLQFYSIHQQGMALLLIVIVQISLAFFAVWAGCGKVLVGDLNCAASPIDRSSLDPRGGRGVEQRCLFFSF